MSRDWLYLLDYLGDGWNVLMKMLGKDEKSIAEDFGSSMLLLLCWVISTT